MMHARDLSLARSSDRLLLSQVDFALAPGEVLGVLGANGAGKSTLVAALAGELAPRAGVITLAGDPLERHDAARQARQRAVMTQQSGLAFDLGVGELVAMGAYPFPESSPDQVRAWVGHALEMAELTALTARRYSELSGGEQRLAHFARAIVQCLGAIRANDEAYLLLDEPLAGLDPRHQILLLRAVQDIVRQGTVGALIVMHDVNAAARWCHRIALLAGGRMVACGPPREVLTPSHLREVYAVEMEVLDHPIEPGRLLVLERDDQPRPSS